MANEITTNQATGLTLTARLVLAGAFVGAVITLTESSTVSGHYTGSPPGGTAANVYTVLVFNGATRISDSLLRWDGANEVLPASQASVTAILAAIAGIIVTDPLLATVPGAYPVGTAGNAIGKLNAVAAAGPVAVIPGPPPDSSMCRLYGYFETVTNVPAAWLGFTITLVGASPIRSTRTLAGLSVAATTDAEGRLSDGANPWIDVQRNDMLGPAADTQYRITCDLAGINILVTLNTESADLMALVFPASAPPPPPPSAVATNPRFGYAPALLAGNNAGLAALFSSMVSLMGSASGGTTGMFNTAASTTNFTWIAVLASAAGPDIRIFDGTGYGGFSGAGSPGLYAPGEIDPSAISLPYTDGNANLWKMFRSDGKAVTYSTFTLS